jgi:hypothetical protein
LSKRKNVYRASTAESSAKVAVVNSDEIGRSAVYKKYNSGPRTLLEVR